MKHQGWSLRSKMLALLLLPLLSLSALWTYAAYLSLDNALTLVHVDVIGNHLARPLGQVFIELQTERRASLMDLSSGPAASGGQGRLPGVTADESPLARSRAMTDGAVAEFSEHASMGEVRDSESAQVKRSIATVRETLGDLGLLRQRVDKRRIDASHALEEYTAINAAISEAFEAMTVLPDKEAQRFGHSLYTQTVASDFLSQEDALISASAFSGRMTRQTYALIVQDIGASRRLVELAMRGMPDTQRKAFMEYAQPGGPLEKVRTMEEQLTQAGPSAGRLPFPVSRWRAAYDAQWLATNELALDDIDVVFTMTGPPALRALWELGIAGALGLIALIVSALMSVRMGRSLVGDVSRLRESARNLTEDRLRDVVGRLRRGEKVDVRSDMTQPVFVTKELAYLGDAFFALQTTAVDLAAEDVRLHRHVNDVFVNLARRSQVLVHRQLGLLESMEHREEDPNRLADLYRLDQMAMRLRRYAESLITVSGSSTGRVWRRPVPAVDVVRGAAAETEHYARVSVLPVPDVSIAGRAVADIVHLLAELIENAEHFSPADTEVRVNVGTGTKGLVVEVDDRGLGMSQEGLEAANARLREQVEVSTLDSTRLGLITVQRLAKRHGIGVTLRHSPYGGVTAVVLIPHTLLEDPRPEARHSAPGASPHRLRTPSAALGHQKPQQQHQRPARALPAGGGLPFRPPATDPGDGSSAVGGDTTWSRRDAHRRQMLPTPQDAPVAGPVLPAPAADEGVAQEPEFIDGLPRRVRQASLAPELRGAGIPLVSAPIDWSGGRQGSSAAQPAFSGRSAADSALPHASHDGTAGLSGRTDAESARPAQVRTLMSALQEGSARGRRAGRDAPSEGHSFGTRS
ncbi:nitrate- and nitrite sensing domain-containing protein [Streptomyces olivaceoviridis]